MHLFDALRNAFDAMLDPGSLALRAMADDDFVLPPLPNHLSTRDIYAWIYGGVAINSERKKARMRETLHYEVIYR